MAKCQILRPSRSSVRSPLRIFPMSPSNPRNLASIPLSCRLIFRSSKQLGAARRRSVPLFFFPLSSSLVTWSGSGNRKTKWNHGCQMANAKFVDCWPFRLEGLWLPYMLGCKICHLANLVGMWGTTTTCKMLSINRSFISCASRIYTALSLNYFSVFLWIPLLE